MSEIDIANGALDALGQEPILRFDDPGKLPALLKRRYAISRDQLIEMHRWNFAIDRRELVEDTAAPVFGFDRAFTIPTDVIRVVELDDQLRYGQSDYQIEGRRLLANTSAPARVVVLKRVTDTSLYPPLFRRALELFLAMDIAESVTDSTGKKNTVSQMFRRVLAEAKAADARGGRPPSLATSRWLDVHDSGHELRDTRTIVFDGN